MAASSAVHLQSNSHKILRDIVDFHKSPVTFFLLRKTDEDGFVLDLLQSIYSEELPETIKIQVIGVLEEQSSVLLTNATSIEQTIGSLKNIYYQLKGQSWVFKSQVLVTMTAILLNHNQLVEQQQLVVDLVYLLLNIMSKVNNGSDRLIRGTACECLREIETMHPGILMRKVEHLYAMSQLENTHVFQAYMALFVTVLKNATLYLTSSTISKSNAITNMLCNRKEPLKPLNLPEDFTKNMFQLLPWNVNEITLLSLNVDTRELKRASAFLMENLCLMTTSMQCYILNHILQYIVTVPSLSSSMFKSHLLELSSTFDLSLFHVALQLKTVFNRHLINDTEEDVLLQRLLLCTNHPSLTAAHRLLCSDWLRYFPEDNTNRVDHGIPKKLIHNNLWALFPKVFDGLDTTLIKLSMLNECFTPSSCQDASSVILMGCVQPLRKSISYGIKGRSAVTLYRVLFQFFKKHSDSILSDEIFSMLQSIVLDHPVFAPHTINFLQCVQHEMANSTFPVDLLRAISENIVLIKSHVILKSFDNYLMLLERISQQANINPQPTLHFILKLLTTSNVCAEGNWLLGNSMLAVCSSCLHHHDTTNIFTDLGDVLYVLLTKFNDLDVRDRARFYYAILTNLSSEKASRVLSQASEASHSLSKLADSINIPSLSPVQRFKKPLLKLTRVSRGSPSLLTLPSATELKLSDYLNQINVAGNMPVVNINYRLDFDDEIEMEADLTDIYAIVLHLETKSRYKEMIDYHIPHLRRDDEDEDVIVQLKFCPLYPIPAVFHVSALFSIPLSRTCISELEDLHVKFGDLFLPLPVSAEHRVLLFEKLWQNIRDNQRKSCRSLSSESVCVLEIPQERMNCIVGTDLEDFVIVADDSENLKSKWFVGIFLPPQSHLLLRIVTKVNISVVSIATDNWKILALVNKYLHELESE